MRNHFFIFFFLVLLPQVINAQSTITIVRGQDFPPYHFIDQSGNPSGFAVEIIRSVADGMNIQIEFKQYPWSRCLKLVELGMADAMMNLFKTRERKGFMYFSNNILAYEVNQFFKLEETSLEYTGDLSELFPFRIGAIRNYSYGPVFDAVKFDNIFRLETETSLIRSLFNKRSDIIIGNDRVIKMLIKKLGGQTLVKPMFPIVSQAPLYIGFSKARGHKKLSDDFSKVLSKFKKSKTYIKIMNKYN